MNKQENQQLFLDPLKREDTGQTAALKTGETGNYEESRLTGV